MLRVVAVTSCVRSYWQTVEEQSHMRQDSASQLFEANATRGADVQRCTGKVFAVQQDLIRSKEPSPRLSPAWREKVPGGREAVSKSR
jgi:hypothetical protein